MAQWAGDENKRYPIGIPLLGKVKIGRGTNLYDGRRCRRLRP